MSQIVRFLISALAVFLISASLTFAQSTTVYQDDFEGAVSGWSVNDTNSTPQLGQFLGLFDVNQNSTSRTFSIPAGSTTAVIEFDLNRFDSWDDFAAFGFDRFEVDIDGSQIFSLNFPNPQGARSGSTGNVDWSHSPLTGMEELGFVTGQFWFDQVHRFTLTVNNPGATLNVTLRADLSQDQNDESAGFDNFSLTVDAPNTTPGNDIVAVAESFSPVDGAVGGNTPSVLTSDTLNGVIVGPNDVIITSATSSALNVSLDQATGLISVAPNSPAGTYTVEYEICETSNPVNCSTVTETLIVTNTSGGGGGGFCPAGFTSAPGTYHAVSATGGQNTNLVVGAPVAEGTTLTNSAVTFFGPITMDLTGDPTILAAEGETIQVVLSSHFGTNGRAEILMSPDGVNYMSLGTTGNGGSVYGPWTSNVMRYDDFIVPAGGARFLQVLQQSSGVRADGVIYNTQCVGLSGSPELTLTKVADDNTNRSVGETITYTYTAENTGDVNINDVTVSDVHNGSGPLSAITINALTNTSGNSSDDAADNDIDVLAPGDSVTFTSTYIVTLADSFGGATITNTATATGSPAGGTLTDPTASESVSVAAQPPGPNSFGTRSSALVDICSVPEANNTFQFDGDGNTTFDGLQISTTSSASTGVSWSNLISAYSNDTRNFDSSEYALLGGAPIGRNGFAYQAANIQGLNDVITQNFSGKDVFELLFHVNSLDQYGLWFDPAENPGLGWEIVSSSDDGGNIGTGNILFFTDILEGDQDTTAALEQADGNAGNSADGTIRFFSTTTNPITQLVWRFVEDPVRTQVEDFGFFAFQYCAPTDADLVTVKTLTSASATPSEGDTVTFDITVTNNGPGDATGVTLTDLLPAGLTATGVNGTVSSGSYDAGTGLWTLGALADGALETLTIEGIVDAGQGGNTITNTLASAASGDQTDPTTAGDDLTEAVTVATSSAIVPAPTAPVITTCAYGEPFEFNNNGSVIYSASPSNNQLFTAQSVQNGVTFDFTILDKSPTSNPLLTPLSGTGHSQSGGNSTNGGIRLLGTKNDTVPIEVDATVGISGGFVTEIEFYAHDLENNETVVYGTTNYVPGTLGAHPGATVGLDQSANTVVGTAGNTNGQSNRSALATYQNSNGLTSLTQTHTVVNGRLGTGFALGTYCVSIVEAAAETFPAITGAGGVTTSVLASDTLNGQIIDPANITFTPGAITGPDGNPSTAITVNADGTVTVPAGTPPGDYIIEYEICDTVNPTNCSTTTETITVTASPSLSMTKTADNPGPYTVGDVVTYTYTVINDGDQIVRDIAITDTHNGSDPAPIPGNETLLTDVAPTGDSTDAGTNNSWDVLAPGDTLTFTGTYTITAIDADNL